jgi:hypothetical protein
MGGLPGNAVLHPSHRVQFATRAKLKVDDYYHNGARRRVRLHEKGGKEHDMPVRMPHGIPFSDHHLDDGAIHSDDQTSRKLISQSDRKQISPSLTIVEADAFRRTNPFQLISHTVECSAACD